VKQFQTHAKILEQNLAVAIDKVLGEFKEETGFGPCEISPRLVNTTAMGDRVPTYTLGEVRVGFNIKFL